MIKERINYGFENTGVVQRFLEVKKTGSGNDIVDDSELNF